MTIATRTAGKAKYIRISFCENVLLDFDLFTTQSPATVKTTASNSSGLNDSPNIIQFKIDPKIG